MAKAGNGAHNSNVTQIKKNGLPDADADAVWTRGAICTYESYLTDKVLSNLVRLIFYTKHSRLLFLF